ncbi:hypothetical protein HPP92_008021 [Vanilla planifolia]|uniref:Uncharacterized protein n=1 Tax=Vanilla planifolia TaxID=51239 RepID=A0A835RBK4_VANPL|nr:hypothetical protein HPP92_008056 [Vanilla planifolia]KAG0491158.1 hypothetical protein HPP92_008021 [Vanilla planifolia]
MRRDSSSTVDPTPGFVIQKPTSTGPDKKPERSASRHSGFAGNCVSFGLGLLSFNSLPELGFASGVLFGVGVGRLSMELLKVGWSGGVV